MLGTQILGKMGKNFKLPEMATLVLVMDNDSENNGGGMNIEKSQ